MSAVYSGCTFQRQPPASSGYCDLCPNMSDLVFWLNESLKFMAPMKMHTVPSDFGMGIPGASAGAGDKGGCLLVLAG